MNAKIINDIGIMAFLQAVNLLLPVFLIPFILHNFDVETYGEMALATSICFFFNVLVDYGFNLTSTSEVGKNANNLEKISDIFISTLVSKILILVVSLLAYLLIVYVFLGKEDSIIIYIVTFGIVIANAMNPMWLFQGLNKLATYSLISVTLKISIVSSIFFIVDEKTDFYIVPLVLSISQIVPAIVTLSYILLSGKIRIKKPKFFLIRKNFTLGKEILLSRLSVYSYSSLNVVFLEIFTTTTHVGYYSIALRVVGAVNSIISVVNQVLFPKMAITWEKSNNEYVNYVKNIRKKLGILNVLAFISILLLSKYIINFLSNGDDNVLSILVLMSFSVIFFSFGSFYTQSFVVQNRNKMVLNITLITTLLNFVMVFTIVPFYGVYGMAVIVSLLQLFQFLLNTYYFNKLSTGVKN